MRGATPASGGDLGGADEHVGDADPRRRQQAGQADHRHLGGPRQLDQGAAGAGDDPAGAERLRRPRSRRASPRSRPSSSSRGPSTRRSPSSAARSRGSSAAAGAAGRRAPPRRGRRRSPSRPSRRRAGRPLGGRDPRRLDPPERVAEVVGNRQDVVEHRPQLWTFSRRPATAPSTVIPGPTSAPGARIEPLTRAPSPTVRAVEQDRFADLGAGADPATGGDDRARPDHRVLGDLGGVGDEHARRGRLDLGPRPRPSRMSQLACR